MDMNNTHTNAASHRSLLPLTRVITYDLSRNVDRLFRSPEEAETWVRESGAKCVNVYRIERVNGTWRTDW